MQPPLAHVGLPFLEHAEEVLVLPSVEHVADVMVAPLADVEPSPLTDVEEVAAPVADVVDVVVAPMRDVEEVAAPVTDVEEVVAPLAVVESSPPTPVQPPPVANVVRHMKEKARPLRPAHEAPWAPPPRVVQPPRADVLLALRGQPPLKRPTG